jgi:lysophospholipase L1-like esterase
VHDRGHRRVIGATTAPGTPRASLFARGLSPPARRGKPTAALEPEPKSTPSNEHKNGLVSPTAAALVTLASLIALPYVVPRAQRLRLLEPLPEGAGLVAAALPAPSAAPSASVGEAKIAFETSEQAELRQPEVVAIPAAAREAVGAPTEQQKAPRSIEDPSGRALDPFLARLAAAERKEAGAIARISYYGDSIVASDFVTATLRRRLQKRFGDAGHGFMLMANAWPGYFHNDVVRFAAPGWTVSRVVGPFAKDGLYGLGGVSFRSEGPGVFSRFATTKTGSFGRAVSRFVIDYLEQPGGGAMEVKIDGQTKETVDTRADSPRSALRTYPVPEGEHELEVRALSANVRTFGVWMERDAPGVVLDALGIQGCRIRFLDQSDDAHWAEQLKLRDPSLTVFEYGMNESEDGELYPLDQYEATMKAVLQQVKSALPAASCLLVGPMDRAEKRGDSYRSRPVVPKLAALQRKVAGEVGCAYFDTLGAMGGFGSMETWHKRGLGGADLAHPSSAGAEVLGNWVYLALMEAYDGYRARAAQGR